MTPRADEYEQENLSASDDDDDDDDEGLKEDMAALSRACMIAAAPDSFTAPATTDHDGDGIQVAPADVQDPLLDAGDAVIPVTADSDEEEEEEEEEEDRSDLEYLKRVQSLYQPLSCLPPLPPMTMMTTTASDDEEEDDIETLRVILKRFSAYDEGPHECSMATLAERDQASSLVGEGDTPNGLISYRSEAGELCAISQDHSKATNLLTGSENIEMQPSGFVESYKPDACKLSKLPQKRSSFPLSAQAFIDAIKKNRSLQRFLRSKLIEIEAKIEENKRLRDKVKLLKDFQAACIRRTGSALSQKKDPRVQLISAKKSSTSNNSKSHNKKMSAMCYGPAENSHVTNYKMVLERFPISLDRKKWSNVERENLTKGIKQQFQEMVLQISVDRMSSECTFGDANDMDNILASVKDLEITPERIREFLPKVNCDRLASMYVVGRTGAECESRWLNCEDPLINHGPWTSEEDKFLLYIVQDMGIRNWFDIAVSLATNRTPFQCLARYQRSLNPSMLNSEWTEEEDAQLCSAVAIFGGSDWQSVASVLDRRTGTQCSNRWKKSLCPERKGSFTQEEDERLTVAVMLFGRKWNHIAKFVSGRIQSQCRDRYLNSLDPSLKWGGWTEEEDSRLKAAIAKHGYCWSKVAEDVPPRTDSQCRKRWKVLCPDEVPLLQAARKMQKEALASNFVDRESERPALTLNDFLPLAMLCPPSDADYVNLPTKRKRKRKSSNVPKEMRPKKHAKKPQIHPEEVSNEVKTCSEDDVEKDSSVPANGNYTEDKFGNCTTNTGRIRKQHCCRKNSAKDSLEHHRCQGSSRKSSLLSITGGKVLGSSSAGRTVSKKESKNSGKLTSNIRGAEPSENKLDKSKMSKAGSQSACMESLDSQDGDNITLACFLHNKSKKRQLKFTKNVSQASFSSRTAVVSESLLSKEQAENQIPSGVQDGLSQTCGTGGIKDLFMEHNVTSPGQLRKPEDVNVLTDDDDDGDMTLACLLGNKLEKWGQTAKGRRACSSSNLKKRSLLLPEVHCASKPTIIADDNGPSMAKLIEGQNVLHSGVAEPTNINAEGKDDLLASFLQYKKRRGRRRPESHKGNC